jgi:hypothetical protein
LGGLSEKNINRPAKAGLSDLTFPFPAPALARDARFGTVPGYPPIGLDSFGEKLFVEMNINVVMLLREVKVQPPADC